jgi:hypothetical protein
VAGLSDKTFLKLVVVGNQVELRREVNDASGTAPANITPVLSGLDTKTVRLRMVVDPATNTMQGFYSLDGTNYTSVGGGVSTSGSGITGGTAYARPVRHPPQRRLPRYLHLRRLLGHGRHHAAASPERQRVPGGGKRRQVSQK